MSQRSGRGVVGVVLACLALVAVGCGEQTQDEQVADVMRRTEDIRGLAATEPVPYRFVPADEAFDDLIDEWLASDEAPEAEAEALILERLGLLPPGFDILEVMEWSTRIGVLGYYDPETDEITVVTEAPELGPDELSVLAHEHAHALQDRHFGLDEDEELDADETAALDALIEGEATLVGAVFTMKRLGFADLEELEEVPTDVMPIEEVPPILVRGGEFPYLDGSAFVFDRWHGDWEAIDALWADPPASTEQIMHPERYPDDVPVKVELPDIASALGPDWQLADEMVMGEMQIGVLLADGRPWDYGDEDEAFTFPRLRDWRAAEGWGGDRLAHLTGPRDDWAIVWQTTWDSAADAEQFSEAAKEAFEDLDFRTGVGLGVDVTDAEHAHPVLVLVSPDRETASRLAAVLATMVDAA